MMRELLRRVALAWFCKLPANVQCELALHWIAENDRYVLVPAKPRTPDLPACVRIGRLVRE
jgi:hypothetical protein